MSRAWWVAALASVAFLLVVAVPTDLINTPLFSRQIPAAWWSWPALLVSSVLGGLITATYVRPVERPVAAGKRPLASTAPGEDDLAPGRGTTLAGLLTFFAVGCPVCNKLVLFALGASGAVTWFQPFQPVLQVAALVLLTWALVRRLRTRTSCALPSKRDRSRPTPIPPTASAEPWSSQ